MFQFLLGFTTGIYVAQNYNIPQISVITKIIQEKLAEIEKEHKKND
jgi:hypothetical protein|tara:strand:- start:2297 stop:2434 length:138 start_codon:yes stop_codon:yes gene_type:complete